MRNRLLALAGTSVLALTILTACGSGSDDSASSGSCTPAHDGLKTVSKGQLTNATYNFPPFVALKGNDATGLEGDILGEVAKMECLSLKVTPLDPSNAISATQSGRADVASGNWYCTTERTKVLALAGPVYGDQIGLISKDGAKTFDDLKGRSIGTVDGYLWNDEFKKIFGSDLKVYPNPTAVYNDLKAGRIEAAADSFGSATYANKQRGNPWKVTLPEPDDRVASSLEPVQVCFPMTKANKALADAVTEDLEVLRTDGKLADILEKNGLDSSAADTGALRLIG